MEAEHAAGHVCVALRPEVVADGAPPLTVVVDLDTTRAGVGVLTSVQSDSQRRGCITVSILHSHPVIY